MNLAAHLFNSEVDFYPGPLTDDGAASISTEVSEQYDQVWSVTAVELALHRSYFACLENPECDIAMEFPNGYEIPQVILDWPAMCDPSLGQSVYLAHFVDYDLDGDYIPANGDYPCTAGDGALYVIYNDKLALHTQSGGGQIGVEVHMMPFAYANTGPFLAQTVFVHYTIINRGTQTLNDFRIGNFADLDIGCSNDDIVGTDVGRSMVYAYNGDDVDDALCAGAQGFGEHPPAFGMVVLKGPRLDADGLDNTDNPAIHAFNGRGYNDGFIDNERHGLDQSMYYNGHGSFLLADPGTAGQFFLYLRSIWPNGTPLTYGGDGYAGMSGAPVALFAFPGSSDPLGLGTAGVPQPSWSEELTTPLDPRSLATMGPITLEPGAEHDILIAYVYARAEEGGALASVAALQQRVDSVAEFAETIPGLMATGTACDAVITSGIRNTDPHITSLALYPVPATNMLTVRTSEMRPGTILHIFDARGALVAETSSVGPTTTIDLTTFASGLYTLQAIAGRVKHHGRFMKE